MKTFTHEMDVQHYAYIDGFEEGREDGLKQGREQGIEQGRATGLIEGTINSYRELGQKDDTIINVLISKYNLDSKKAEELLNQTR